MSRSSSIGLTCPKCGRSFSISSVDMVNVGVTPEMKETVLNGSLFIAQCPACGSSFVSPRHFVYIDPQQKVLLILSKEELKIDDLQGMTGRRVETVGDLIEKIKIFDAGLDDVAVEMCKFVTSQEIGKDFPMKFFKLDGADNEITLTYPENGQMQMVTIGFNIYEDCRGIISRNRILREESLQFAKVDAEWLLRFLK